MNKVIKKSFDILVKNSAIMQPLILFLLIFMIFSGFLGMRIFLNPFILLLLLMFSAFLSGWLNIIKYAVDNYKPFDKNGINYSMEVANYNIETMKRFFSGVGEYFISILCFVIICIFIFAGVSFSAQYFFPVNQQELLNAINDNTAFMAFMKTNLKIICFYLLYFFSVLVLIRFLLLFWLPSMYYKVKNPFTTIFSSIVFLFRNFMYSLGIFSFIFACTFIVSFIGLFLMPFRILSLLFFIVQIYFQAFVWIFTFCAYKEKILQEEIEKINARDVFIKSSEMKEKKDVDEK